MSEPMTRISIEPQGWGDDLLSRAMKDFQGNWFASFDNLKDQHAIANKLLERYEGFATNYLHHPKEKIIQAQFFIRAYFLLRSTLNLAYGGSIADSYCILRNVVEVSLYAYAVTQDEDLKPIWLDRDKSDENKKKCRKAFKTGLFISQLAEVDSDLGEEMRKLYEFCIDQGAHPNQASIIEKLFIEKKEDEENPMLMQVGLSGDKAEIKQTIEFIVFAGYHVLQVFQHVFPDRFKLSGLDKEIY